MQQVVRIQALGAAFLLTFQTEQDEVLTMLFTFLWFSDAFLFSLDAGPHRNLMFKILFIV